MSQITVNNVKLYYQSVGNGPETILFSHGYLMDNTMFNGQIDAFRDRFRCISFDHRGHGKSEVTKSGYEIDNLVTDAISLIEALDPGATHFVGMSTGGIVGTRIALRRPDLLKSLILMDTTAEEESEKAKKRYNLMMWMVNTLGWWTVIGQTLPIIFHEDFLKDRSRQSEVKNWRNIITGHSVKGVLPFGKAITGRDSILTRLTDLSLPVAVIVGDQDIATPPDYSQRMADVIPNSKLYKIENAGHSAAIEKPAEVAAAMRDFYTLSGII